MFPLSLQDYYENVLLKEASPYTMYVLLYLLNPFVSRLIGMGPDQSEREQVTLERTCGRPIYFTPRLLFACPNGYRLVELGSALHKYVLLPRLKFTDRPSSLSLFPCTHIWPPIRSWQHFHLRIEYHEFWRLRLCQGFGIGVSVQKCLSSPLLSSPKT